MKKFLGIVKPLLIVGIVLFGYVYSINILGKAIDVEYKFHIQIVDSYK